MESKEFTKWSAIALIGVLIYYLLKRKQNISSQTIVNNPDNNAPFIGDPNLASYLPSPGFQPQTTPININIGNQGLNYLNDNYIPLFGFVGVAQGETLQ